LKSSSLRIIGDTDNNVEKDFDNGSPFNEEDWEFYKACGDGTSTFTTKRSHIPRGCQRTNTSTLAQMALQEATEYRFFPQHRNWCHLQMNVAITTIVPT